MPLRNIDSFDTSVPGGTYAALFVSVRSPDHDDNELPVQFRVPSKRPS